MTLELVVSGVEEAWKRGNDRENEPWCEFCGKPEAKVKCGACKGDEIWYCCNNHMVNGWESHQWSCEQPEYTSSDFYVFGQCDIEENERGTSEFL